MAISFSVRTDISEKMKEEYQKRLTAMTPEQLIAEFISYLDYTEESESGREFHPISIGSVRVLMTQTLDMVLQKMREYKNV